MMIRTQSAALPYRRNSARELEVLLITSRRKGLWGIPKGTVRRMLPHSSAAREAFEEAGVLGIIGRQPIGIYHVHTHAPDSAVPVQTFPLFVNTLLLSWPEMAFRQRRWLHVLEAAEAVENDELRAILLRFAEKYWKADPA